MSGGRGVRAFAFDSSLVVKTIANITGPYVVETSGITVEFSGPAVKAESVANHTPCEKTQPVTSRRSRVHWNEGLGAVLFVCRVITSNWKRVPVHLSSKAICN